MTDERKAFEELVREEGGDIRQFPENPGEYIRDKTQHMWEGWLARAALTQGEATAAPLPSSPESAGALQRWGNADVDEVGRKSGWHQRDDGYWTPWHLANARLQEAGAREPVAWMHECRHLDCDAEDGAVISAKSKEIWMGAKPEHVEHYTIPLYAHPPTTGAIEAQELAVKQANLAADYMLRAEAATGAIEALRELMRANPNAYAGELLEMYDAMQAALAPPSP
jgi:hypothetical protein